MDEQITKERLKKYIYLRREVENHLERLARMKNQALIPARREDQGGGHSGGASDRMAEAIIRRLSYEDRTAEEINAKLDEMDKVREAVGKLDDPLEREVLRLRYIDGTGYKHMPWRNVAAVIYGSDDGAQLMAVYRAHGRALQHIIHILDIQRRDDC